LRVTLNLATRPFADLGPAIKRLRIAMAALAVVAIGLGFGLHALHHKADLARARDHSLDGQIAHVTQEREGYQALMRQPANAELLDQSIALNKIFDDKSFSWTLAMEELETVLPGQVLVSSLEPVRAKDGHITIHLRVAGPRNLSVDLVRNLEHSRHFLLPRIVGETSESADAGPNKPLAPASLSDRVDFDLLADYNPDVPLDRRASKKQAKNEGTGNEAPAPRVESTPDQHARRVYTGPVRAPSPQRPMRTTTPTAPRPTPLVHPVPGDKQ
jgi:type IV pilus assembly protein PilN